MYDRPVPASIILGYATGDLTTDSELWLNLYDRLREAAAVGEHGYFRGDLMLATTISSHPR